MRLILLALLALPQGEAPSGLVVERTVKQISTDTLGRRREIHRREIVRIRGANVSVTDVTFGGRLIISADRKKVWKVDPLAGEYSELTFDEVAAARGRAVEELRAAKARVPGTADEKELEAVLEGLDQFAAEPSVELRTAEGRRELIVNGDRVRLSAQLDASHRAPGYFEALQAIGGFHPSIGAKLRELSGFPAKGTLRYVLFLDRMVDQFETTAVRAEEVPAAEFEPPQGLKEVPLAGFEPAPERRPRPPAQFRRDFKEDEVDRQNSPLRREEKKEPEKGKDKP